MDGMMNGMGMGMSTPMVLACLLVLLILVLVSAAAIKYLFFDKARRDPSSSTGRTLVDSQGVRMSPAGAQHTTDHRPNSE